MGVCGSAIVQAANNPLYPFVGSFPGSTSIDFGGGSVSTGAGTLKLTARKTNPKAKITLSTVVVDPIFNDATPLDITLAFDGKGKLEATAATYAGYTASGAGKYSLKKGKLTFSATLVLSDGSVTATVTGTLKFTAKAARLDALATFDPGPGPQSWHVQFSGKKKKKG